MLWVRKGLKDFCLVAGLGFSFVFVSTLIIKTLVEIGLSPAYASTIISLCLLFMGTMFFSYLEYKNNLLEKEKSDIITDAIKKRKQK